MQLCQVYMAVIPVRSGGDSIRLPRAFGNIFYHDSLLGDFEFFAHGTTCFHYFRLLARISLVTCDESRHTILPFVFVVLSWGELWLICRELSLILPRASPNSSRMK